MTTLIPRLSTRWTVLAAFALALSLRPSPCLAQVIYVRADASSGGDGSSWDRAYRTISPALSKARDNPILREIWVAKGSYSQSSSTLNLVNGVALYGGFSGTETLRDERDWIANTTILQGRSTSSPYLTATALSEGARIDGFLLTGASSSNEVGGLFVVGGRMTVANTTFSACRGDDAAAIMVTGGVLDLHGVTLTSNTSSRSGIYAEDSQVSISDSTFGPSTDVDGINLTGGRLAIDNCVFRSNKDFAIEASAMAAVDATRCTFTDNTYKSIIATATSDVTFAHCVWSYNHPVSGPVIEALASNSLTLNECIVDQNIGSFLRLTDTQATIASTQVSAHSGDSDVITASGGYLHVQQCVFRECATNASLLEVFGAAQLALDGCDFINNAIPLDDVASLVYVSGDRAEFQRCTFTGNSVVKYGLIRANGAAGRTLLFDACEFHDNVSEFGASVLNAGGQDSITMRNCIFSGNRRSYGDGGVLSVSPSVLDLEQCVFVNNVVAFGSGGVIRSYGATVHLRNSSCAGNRAPWGSGGVYVGDSLSMLVATNSVFWDDQALLNSEIAGPAAISYSCIAGGYEGTGNIDRDPRFVNPADGDLRPDVASALIDAGSNSEVDDLLTSDIDGQPRFADDDGSPDTGEGAAPVVDIGAYEFQGTTFALLPPVPGMAGRVNSFKVVGATAGDQVIFAYALRTGRTAVPGCPGLFTDLDQPTVFGHDDANASGGARVDVNVPSSARGRTVMLQVVGRGSCLKVTPISWTFE